MSLLTIYNANNPAEKKELHEFEEIRQALDEKGIKFRRWQANKPVSEHSTQEEILEAYKEEVNQLNREHGFLTADVISVNKNFEKKIEMRAKFLNEHTHSEDEARFFIDGVGLFCIHSGDKIYALRAEKNDLINVPAHTKHWFDMGEYPFFKCIRFFTNEEGWVAQFTGDKIADQFPRLATTA